MLQAIAEAEEVPAAEYVVERWRGVGLDLAKAHERRLFLRSDTETRFIRLRPAHQLLGWTVATAVVGWTIISTAILLMDSIGSGNFRAQAQRDQMIYEARLNALSSACVTNPGAPARKYRYSIIFCTRI